MKIRNFLMSFRVTILLIALNLPAFTQVYGQTSRIRFQHLTTEDGLAQNMVDCMLQDSQGFIWIGTWNGLCRYDGYTFEVFDKENNKSSSFSNNFIYGLKEDHFGNIWIATARGLYVYLYDQGKFVAASNLSERPHPALDSHVATMSSDNDSSIYIGTDLGFLKIIPIDENGAIEIASYYGLGSGSENLLGSKINTIEKDKDGALWVGTDEGISLVEPGKSQITRFQNSATDPNTITSNHVLKIFESQDGLIWIGTEYGLNRYDPESDAVTRFFHSTVDQGSLPHNTVTDIIEGPDGNLIVSTLGGLGILKSGGGNFISYTNESRSEYDLNNDFINCLMLDRQGNIWIGTERGGINFYNVNQNKFEHFESQVYNSNSLNTSTVNSVFEDKENIWIGTAGGGLNRFIKRKNQYIHYMNDPNDPASISSNFITTIFRDREGRLWVGSWGGGLNIWNPTTETFEHFQTVNAGLVSNFISSTIQLDDGSMLVGTLGGLSKLNPGDNQFETIFTGENGLRVTAVGCLLQESNGDIWVGTQSGLFQISGKSSYPELTRYLSDPKNDQTISGSYVISAFQDSKGDLWFGTYGQGVNKLIRENGEIRFERFDTGNGLSNNIIYGILEDKSENLWLSTDFGLSRLNISTEDVRNFFIPDGLMNNQYYWSAAYKNSDGKLYFGGMDGLDTFYPHWVNERIVNPEVVFTDLRVFSESVIPGEEYHGTKILTKDISKVSEINLSYKEKMFAVEFSSMNYQEPEMIYYAYKLEGFDEKWNFVPSSRRFASYTNLKPGKYTFKVKASASNGEFTSLPTQLSVVIAPPFWETWWFRVFAVAMAVGLILAFIRWRTYNLNRQKRILEKQVAERTERINEQKEALSYQAIQLKTSNKELEHKKAFIEGQNDRLEGQNREILTQRDELIKLNKKLKMISQLRLSFFTNISHEFRTPLTLIIGPLEKLMKEDRFDHETQNIFNVINRNAHRMLHLINQIMDFRKIEQGRMELKVNRGNIKHFCQEVFEAFKPLADVKHMDFIYKVSSIPDEVWYDVRKLENILYNLLSNAFKYSGDYGCIKLEVCGLSLKESKLSGKDKEIADDKNVISIRVSDTGFGISEENLPMIFKRFYRVDSDESLAVGGSGIGLALTKDLIKTHHGDIFVDSQPGKGSVFEIQFPCLKGAYGTEEVTEAKIETLNIREQVEVLKGEFLVDEPPEQNELGSKINKEKSTVLVVEDNPDLRKFMVQQLKDKYNTLEAEDGQIGIYLAEKFNPDIIISDVMMPNVDGLELCATIKNNLSTSHIPVILLTAKSSVEDQIEGLENGADDYLPKPFNFELLEARLSNLLESRKKLRQQFMQSGGPDAVKVPSHSKDRKFIEQVLEIVETNLSDSQFGVQEFVKSMGISRSLLHKKLTALTGKSAAEFINQSRMKKAMVLLRKNELNISEVAYSVGYNDPKYFSRLFSKHFGQSPKEFIKNPVEID